MGVIINHSNDLKSNLFSCFNYSNEKNSGINAFGEIKVNNNQEDNYYMKDINYFRLDDTQIAPNKYIRSYSLLDKNDLKKSYDYNSIKSNNFHANYREENIYKFNKEKYEFNPKIRELEMLMGKDSNFMLT